MNILHLHPGPDTGGQSVAGKRVLEAAGHTVRVFTHHQHPFGYAASEKWEDDLVRDAFRDADVVIAHNDATVIKPFWDGGPKNIIVHHHGTRFRTNPGPIYAIAAAIAARQIVSTVDLLLSVPDGGRAEWFPQVVDTDRMRHIRDLHRPGAGRPRITHAPTNRQVKGTRFVVRARKRLKGEYDFVIITRQPWTMCLTIKATSDLFIDQLILGYGNNAIEAWAMGIPVLAGATDPIAEAMRREFGELPFYRTTPDMLVPDIRTILRDSDIYARLVEAGTRHVERYHAPEAWLERAMRLYSGEPVHKRRTRRKPLPIEEPAAA